MFEIFKTSKAKKETRSSGVTNLRDPDRWFGELFGMPTAAGVNVNVKTALSIPTFWAALKKRGGTIGSLSCEIFENTPTGAKPAPKHPLYNLVNSKPHPLYNSFVFWMTLVVNVDAKGDGFVRIRRKSMNARPFRLDLVMKEDVLDLIEMDDGQFYYIINEKKVGNPTPTQKAVSIDDMIHIRGLSMDGLFSEDPIQINKECFGGGIAANKYTSAFFGNNAHVNFVIESPQLMSDKARTKFNSWWSRTVSGMKNAFKNPIILDQGSKLHKISLNPQEASLEESKKSVAADAARIVDTPAHMVGLLDKATFSNIEVQNNEFLMFSIRNTLKQIETEFNNKIFSTSETNKQKYFIRFNLDSLLRSDAESRTKKLETEIKWGIISRDEARQLAGYQTEPNNNFILTPMNMEDKLNPDGGTDNTNGEERNFSFKKIKPDA
jgi:HK97 family phage portal protein